MATLSYSIRFGTGTWESINDICSGKEVAIVGNLCSNGFKSVADTASFVLRYTGSAHYVTVANSILTAQANNTDVFVRFQKVAGAILFEGKVDLDKLSIKSTKIPTELSLSAKDYTYELDEAPKVNVVYDQRTVKQIVDGLLDSSTTSTSRKSVHTWPSDGLENLVPDVPMVITTDDKTTYRQRIDVLLQEMGGYVLNLDPSDGYYKVRKVVNDTVITASSDAVNYMVTDALVTDRSLWTNDGLVIKYPTVVRETEKKLVYTYMPSLKDATDGEHVVGDEIEVNAFWPKDGDLKATYQEFDTQYVDTAYNTNETREQNADLDLYYVDPGTGTTPDIDMKMVVSDSDFNRVSNWYSMPAVPSIYKEAGIQMYPRKTWILLKNTSGKKLNLTHFEIKGKPVYRSRVNHLIAPVDCSDPYEYEASYVATQSRVEALAQFMYNLKANSSSVSKWTDKWDAHNLGDKVKVQHKGHGTNGMGWLTCFIAAKSMKMIGDELYAEYTAVAISGWTALPQADNHTTLTSTGNTQDAYSQWLAQGNTGTREEWIASMKGEDGKGISSVEVKYGKTDGYVSGGHSDVEHETSEARIKSLKVYGGDEVHGESATSGGVATVGTTEKGKAWLKKVEGKSVAIKNLAPQNPKDFFTGVNNGTKTVNSDNSVTFTASGASPNFYTSASWSFSACRLLVAAKIVASGAATAKFSINYVQSEATSISSSTDWILGIISLGSAITNQRFYFNVTNATSGDTIQFTDIRVYSLTHMFGSGDEPTSTSDPRISLVKSFIEANPYNAGGLYSSTLSKVVSKDSDGETMQSVTLPSLTLKGVGSACDTYLPSEGKVQRKVKTLSSSAWAYDSGWGAWRLRNLDISPTNSGSEAPSLISSYYTVTPYSSGFSDKCLTAFNSLGSSLLIKDSDYTSDQAEAFNTHMAEVTILYPTTTPTEETSTTIESTPIRVEEGGTLTLNSGVAQAEGVFGIDSINIMDGLTEVQIEADNCLSWEDHEEDTSNGILALPSTEIAEWAEVEKVEGKTEAYSTVDLGTLTYLKSGDHTFYTIISDKVAGTSNFSCDAYSTGADASWSTLANMEAKGDRTSQYIAFRNDTYSDASAFKTAMNGVTLRYDGTSNSLHSSTLSKVVSKGRNLWDESSATNLSYTSKDGNIFYYSTISSNSAWTSSNVIGYDLESSTTFTVSCYAKCGTATSIGIVWVYSDGTTSTAIGRGSTSSSSFSRVYSTSDSSKTIAGIGFFYGANGTAYIKDIQIEKGSSVTDYIAPHSSQNVTLPSIELKEWETYIPETGKKESRYEEHLLSSDFTWSGSNPYVGTPVGFTLDKADHSDSILVGYTYTTAAQTQMDDKTYRLITNLRVKDSSYGSLSEFVASLTGKKLLFKKSTVTETTVAEPIDPYIAVEAGGSVSVISTNAQAEATIHYLS